MIDLKKIEIDLFVLDKLYSKHRFSISKLAELFECSPKTIQRRLKSIGYDLLLGTTRDEFGRIHSKGKKLPPSTRENNGNYRGGISIYRTLAFDDYGLEEKCYHCDETNDVIIHHKDKNRYNNDVSNLRPVCRSCHMKYEHPDIIEYAQKARLEKLKEKKKQRLREKFFSLIKEIEKEGI